MDFNANMFGVIIFVFMQCCCILCDFRFPAVKFEAFSPEGLKVTFEEIDDIKQIAFHGNLNRPMNSVEPGDFGQSIVNPKMRGWSFFEPNLKLKRGDNINYWIYVQHGRFGYRKEGLTWQVSDLTLLPNATNTPCMETRSLVIGLLKVCGKQLIFDSNFATRTLDEINWKRAHYIPSEPDYEFCSYQKRNDTTYFEEDHLVIEPIPIMDNEAVRGTLDLRTGCTSSVAENCFKTYEAGFILPPVVSAQMRTTLEFKYGTVEVKAKLPSGDWLYPEIYLQSSSNPAKKIWIAYSRGNTHLSGSGGEDLGTSILFGGPLLNTSEPERSRHLSSLSTRGGFSENYHKYSVTWTPTKITLSVDDSPYGGRDGDVVNSFDEPMHLVLGLGVGGITDFPDFYVSTNNMKKPWMNTDRLQFKKFFNAKSDWLSTWDKNGRCLKIEYVKIWSL